MRRKIVLGTAGAIVLGGMAAGVPASAGQQALRGLHPGGLPGRQDPGLALLTQEHGQIPHEDADQNRLERCATWVWSLWPG